MKKELPPTATAPKPRLEDVARLAKVSPATVSRALSAPHLVNSRTLGSVMAAIRELGYVRDGAASALASRRSRCIGFIVPTLSGAIFAATVHALQTRLFESRYSLLVGSHNYDLDAEVEVGASLMERGIDALVLVGREHSPQLLQIADRFGIPIVLTWTLQADGKIPCIGFDNRKAAAMVAEHLLALGHRRYAVITGHLAGNDRARDRLDGVRSALNQAGIKLADKAVIEQPFSLCGGRDGLAEILRRAPKTTAVICGNDILATGALFAAHERGILVPARMSVTGFDDIELADQLRPRLTTVRVQQDALGRTTANYLVDLLNGATLPRLNDIGMELIVRETTGPAPT